MQTQQQFETLEKKMEQDSKTTRKGPWTEHEDFQLVFHVHMFGDRRWDFIANVSGLKVAGVKKTNQTENIKTL